jgi:hypothetical protein
METTYSCCANMVLFPITSKKKKKQTIFAKIMIKKKFQPTIHQVKKMLLAWKPLEACGIGNFLHLHRANLYFKDASFSKPASKQMRFMKNRSLQHSFFR